MPAGTEPLHLFLTIADTSYIPGRIDPKVLTEKSMHTILYVSVHNGGGDVDLSDILDSSVSLRNDRFYVIHVRRDL